MRKIYLVRHGEAMDDIYDTYGGWADDELTEKGRSEARELGRKIFDLHPKVIYSSPLLRAHQTAQIISEELQVPVEINEDIKERNRYGILTGMTKQEARKKHPGLVEKAKDMKLAVDGAEDYKDFKKRIVEGMDKIIRETTDDILIVTHGGVFREIFWEVLGIPNYKEAKHLSVVEIDQDGDKLTLKSHAGLVFE